MEHKCEICGAVMVRHECPCCHGSGDDPDLAVGDDGRYYQPECWVCGGTGSVPHCPNEDNDAHLEYDRQELRKLREAEAGDQAGQIMIPLETVTAIANYLLVQPLATLADIMAEFDLGETEAIFALGTAKYAIRAIMEEELAN